ncbi:MAG: hypothetical protein KDK89_07280 [Alphaproteobacteria bacterium]|nr:hypothetical protein [Alphaproteobacteria bacterium]
MFKTLLATTALLAVIAVPALAGTAPTKSPQTPADVAMACKALGARGESLAGPGTTGCRNSETGAAVTCDQSGQCTDYFADPRWFAIRAALEGREPPRGLAPRRI